jgi:hypothetical protein
MSELDSVLLKSSLLRLRGNPASGPDASVVIPVNAQKDLANIGRLLSDLIRYRGEQQIEVILVINNLSRQ